ncbi:MAG: hypothetical protein K6D94_00040 [Clostridiales bacterium]|nr:hypothetical protein [Clostridiales bacterium]
MKKRFLPLLLCLLMVLPLVLASCGNKQADLDVETDEDGNIIASNTDNKAMTITLCSIVGDKTTEEDIARIQKAINSYTESEFNTHVLCKFYKESEYDSVIADKIEQIEAQIAEKERLAAEAKAAAKAAKEAARAAAAAGLTTVAETTTEETTEVDETIINSYGIEETVYPAEDGVQMDIFLVRGKENFLKYVEDGIMTTLDEELSINSKILKTYIHPTFFSAAKSGSSTYGIPNNRLVGDYQYMLVDKELVDKYYYDPDGFNSIADLEEYLDDIIKYEPDVIPLMNEPAPRIVYFTSEPSIIGAAVPKNAKPGTKATPNNLLGVNEYMNSYKMMVKYKAAGAIAGPGANLDDGNRYAAAVVSGDITLPEKYEDRYYVSVYKYPEANDNNVYAGMYAISQYAANVTRCMEVLELLTTEPEIINILAYGVEGVDYEINEDGYVVKKSGSTYSMDLNYVGNQFMMTPSSDMSDSMKTLAADNWALAKKQNLDMAYDPYLGFLLNYTSTDKEGNVSELKSSEMTIKQIMDGVVESSKDFLKQIDEFMPYEQEVVETYYVKTAAGDIEQRERTVTKEFTIDDFISELTAAAKADIYIAACLNSGDDNSPVAQYNSWYESNFAS